MLLPHYCLQQIDLFLKKLPLYKLHPQINATLESQKI